MSTNDNFDVKGLVAGHIRNIHKLDELEKQATNLTHADYMDRLKSLSMEKYGTLFNYFIFLKIVSRGGLTGRHSDNNRNAAKIALEETRDLQNQLVYRDEGDTPTVLQDWLYLSPDLLMLTELDYRSFQYYKRKEI